MDTSTTPPPAVELIPTDPAGLYEYLRKMSPDGWVDVVDRLAVQLGGTPAAIERATDLVDQNIHEIEQEHRIEQLRTELAESIQGAVAAVRAATNALGRLSDGDVYDVEYAEGGQRARDLRVFLDDAGRMLRAAAAVNPCPPTKNGADQ